MSLTRQAKHFIDSHQVAHLATADRRGRPHVVPVCYTRLGERLYFVSDDKPKRSGPKALKRLANMMENPKAALVIDDYDEGWTRLAFLLLHMDASLVRLKSEYDAVLAGLRRRYQPYRQMQLDISTHPMVRLKIRGWHLWQAPPPAVSYRRPSSGGQHQG